MSRSVLTLTIPQDTRRYLRMKYWGLLYRIKIDFAYKVTENVSFFNALALEQEILG